ncbi:MAG: tRNA uridine-5-carboxymethylaminomethyl(34) synthesis GTPase MnmE [Desulfohalobiaceae bacterium]|nr:tRNA uridine-5-carboxymethylaminomethyl(34) synthesis GTPase MnmE [Desulfohalobiaceae bacterium]
MLIETIAAVSTPLGPGGIGIIRISGPESRGLGLKLFASAKPGFADFKPYVLHHGGIKDKRGGLLDDVLVSYMPGPGSYTGEDVLEINCHGGPAVVQAVLERVLELGARAAEKGEFTLRAFLNDRLDLSQAESVAELIAAPTQSGLRFAGQKLSGALGNHVADLKERLLRIKADLSADLDFPEDHLEPLTLEGLQKRLQEVELPLNRLLDNFSRYNCLREGALVVLAGRVNAGKSSLLNCLLGRSRAIVTPVPGTTRDYLEEAVNLRGLPVRLVDTAGFREAGDQIELAGLEHGEELIQAADLVCLTVDHSEPVQPEIVRRAEEIGPEKVLVVHNKSDLLPAEQNRPDFSAPGFDSVLVSARTGQGLDDLIEGIRHKIIGNKAEPGSDELVPNLRQREKIRSALQALKDCEQELIAGVGFDALTIYLDEAASRLAEITGEITSDDVLEQIFSRFCIGK